MNLQTAYTMLCSADLYCMVFNRGDDSDQETDSIFTKARMELYCEATSKGITLDHNNSDLRKWQRIRTLEQKIMDMGSTVEVGDSYDWAV